MTEKTHILPIAFIFSFHLFFEEKTQLSKKKHTQRMNLIDLQWNQKLKSSNNITNYEKCPFFEVKSKN